MGIYDKHAKEFIDLYNAGKSIRQIEKLTGVNTKSISRVLKKHITLRPKTIASSFEEDIYKLYIQGQNISNIAASFGVAIATIRKILNVKYGIVLEEKKKKKYDNLKQTFMTEYLEGSTLKEIADKYSVSKQTVLDYINSMNISARTYSESDRLFYVDDWYFNKIDSYEKAYILGFIYATSKILKEHSYNFINISIKPRNLNDAVSCIQKFSNKGYKQLETMDKTETKRIRICSKQIISDLLNIGLYKNLPLNLLDEEYCDSFFSGYLTYSIRINASGIYICCPQYYLEDLYVYFQTKLQITLRKNNTAYAIAKTDDILVFIEKYPFVVEYIEEYLQKNTDSKKWNNILNLYKNSKKCFN